MGVFLQLPPEMGGLRFGPFDGIVNIGTDARRCQIVLDSSQGIYPLHATLAPGAGGTFHFAPADMTAKCFVIQQGSPQLWPAQSAVQVKLGDAIVVGTPAGPRFFLMDAAGHSVARSGAGAGAGLQGMLDGLMGRQTRRPQSFSEGMANEVQRRAGASLMRNSTFRELSYLQRRFKTGQLFSPVTIIGTLATLGTAILAGGVSCSGLAWSLYTKFTF